MLPLLLAALSLLPANAILAATPPKPQIVNSAVRQTEDGPPVPRGETFRPGETVFYSFQLAGYGQSAVKKVRLSYKVEVRDPQGVLIEAPVESILDATLHDEDKAWMPKLRVPVAIPSVVPSGTYRILASVTDDISHLQTQVETTFDVEGHQIASAKELTIRNFAFHRTEEETRALSPAVYRPGDSVFASFDIAGFRYGKENTIEVFFDVALTNPSGKQIYSQAHAAEDRTSSFYPKPWVPGLMGLSLDRDIRPGDYTVSITAHDEVGHQTAEIKQPFSIVQ